jgi:hypothetical protein
MADYIPKIGDIVTPVDGSGMPEPLKEYLHKNGTFGDVRVLDIQGDLISVMPVGLTMGQIWDDEKLSGCCQWLSTGVYAHGFWIYWRFTDCLSAIAVKLSQSVSRFSNIKR